MGEGGGDVVGGAQLGRALLVASVGNTNRPPVSRAAAAAHPAGRATISLENRRSSVDRESSIHRCTPDTLSMTRSPDSSPILLVPPDRRGSRDSDGTVEDTAPDIDLPLFGEEEAEAEVGEVTQGDGTGDRFGECEPPAGTGSCAA